jgi:hypothetical protein
MNTPTNTKALSPFGLAAVALDGEFVEFERLVRELERVTIESDKGLERAHDLLVEVTACRERMSAGMQAMAAALDTARRANEASEQSLASRATAVHERRTVAESMLARFKALGEMVRQVTGAVAQLRPPSEGALSDDDQTLMASRLPEFNQKLNILVGEAQKLMQDAHGANFKSLEQNADSLRQSLQSACNKFNLFVEKHGRPSVVH